MKLEIKNDQNDQKDQKDNETTGYKPSKKVIELLSDYALIGISDKKLYYEISNFYLNKGYVHLKAFSRCLTNHLTDSFDSIERHLKTFGISITDDVEKTDETFESEMDAFELMYELEKNRIAALNDIMLVSNDEKDLIHTVIIQDLIKIQLSVCRKMQIAYNIMKREGGFDLKGRDIMENIVL